MIYVLYLCEIISAYSNLKIIDDFREKNETYPEGSNKHIIKELSKSFSHTSRFIFFSFQSTHKAPIIIH